MAAAVVTERAAALKSCAHGEEDDECRFRRDVSEGLQGRLGSELGSLLQGARSGAVRGDATWSESRPRVRCWWLGRRWLCRPLSLTVTAESGSCCSYKFLTHPHLNQPFLVWRGKTPV